MKRLYISIIFSVLSALFLINWGVDRLASNQATEEGNSELSLHQALLDGFEHQLSRTSEGDLHQKATELASQFKTSINLLDLESLALPESLLPELKKPGGLALDSDSTTYLLRQLSGFPDKLIQLPVNNSQENNQRVDLVLTTLLYLGVCFVILLWLFPLTRRLYLLTQTAANIGDGNLTARLTGGRFSYIRPLEKSFNSMATQIETLVADNKVLARSLSHDMRTPLACLRFGVEAALDAVDVDKKNMYINRMDAEISRMEEMTSAFLEYAALERKGLNLNLSQIDINELLNGLIADFSSLAEQYNVTIESEFSQSSQQIEVDPHWCYLAVQNILVNAIRFANKRILVSCQQQDKWLRIDIDDDGPGLPEEDINRMFRPFVKLDTDSSREEGHFGLGLATTVKVMEWHEGQIKALGSKRLSGLCCQLYFPQ